MSRAPIRRRNRQARGKRLTPKTPPHNNLMERMALLPPAHAPIDSICQDAIKAVHNGAVHWPSTISDEGDEDWLTRFTTKKLWPKLNELLAAQSYTPRLPSGFFSAQEPPVSVDSTWEDYLDTIASRVRAFYGVA